MSGFFLLLTIFFVSDLSIQICSLGTLVGSALQQRGLQSTALVVSVSAGGGLLAFLIQTIELKILSRRYSNLVLALLAGLLSAVLSQIPFATLTWFLLVLGKMTLGTLLPSRLLATARNYSERSPVVTNKWLQFSSTAAFLLSLSVSPFLVSIINFSGVFAYDSIAMMCVVLLFVFLEQKRNSKVSIDAIQSGGQRSQSFLVPELYDLTWILVSIFTVYSIAGVFHVFEVPFLTQHLMASPKEVSFIFLLTGISSLVSIPGMRESWLNRSWKSIFMGSSLMLLVASAIYVNASSLIAVGIVAIIIGSSNSFMMLSKTSRVQLFETERARSLGYTLCKLVSNVGFLLSTLIFRWVPSVDTLVRPFTLITIGAIIFIPISLLIISRFRFRQSTVAQYSSILLLLIFISSGKVHAEELRVALPALIETSDPAKAFDASSALVLGQIFDTLYMYSDSNTLLPNLAVSHSISPDSKIIRIKLNPTIKFSDGSFLKASDVIFSFEHAAATMKKELSWSLGLVEGFDDYIKNPKGSHLRGIKTISEHEIEFHLIQPFAQFLQTLTVVSFSILKASGSGFIGTSAYVTSTKDAQSVTLSRRKDITSDAKTPDTIRFLLIPQVQDYLKSAADAKIDIGEIHEIPTKLPEGYRIEKVEYLQAIALIMNRKKPAFDTAEKRCAFSHAFEQSVQTGTYALRPLSLGLPFSWDAYPRGKDYAPPKTGAAQSTTLFADSVGSFKESLNKEVSSKMDKLGYAVKFQRTNLSQLVHSLKTSSYDSALLGYIPDYFDLDALLTPFLKTNQQFNLMGYSNKEVDRLLNLARSILDKAARLQVYKEALTLVSQECPIAFLGSQDSNILVSDRWTLPKLSSLGFHKIKFNRITLREVAK